MVVQLNITEKMINDFHSCAEMGDYQQLFKDYQEFFKSLTENLKNVRFPDNQLCSIISRDLKFLLGYLIECNQDKSNRYGNQAVEASIPGFIHHLKQAVASKKWDGFYQQFRSTADIMITEARKQEIIDLKISYGAELYETFAKRDEAVVAAKKKQEEEKVLRPPTPTPNQDGYRHNLQTHYNYPVQQHYYGRPPYARFDGRSFAPPRWGGHKIEYPKVQEPLVQQRVPPVNVLPLPADNTNEQKESEETSKNNNQALMEMINQKFQQMESRITASFETKINEFEKRQQDKLQNMSLESNKALDSKLEQLTFDMNAKFKEQETQIEVMEEKTDNIIRTVVETSDDDMKEVMSEHVSQLNSNIVTEFDRFEKKMASGMGDMKEMIEGLVTSKIELLKKTMEPNMAELKQELKNIQTQITVLETKMQEFGENMAQREEFSRNETDKLVKSITGQMKEREENLEMKMETIEVREYLLDKKMDLLMERMELGFERQRHQIRADSMDSKKESGEEENDRGEVAENTGNLQDTSSFQEQPELQESEKVLQGHAEFKVTSTHSNSTKPSLTSDHLDDDVPLDQSALDTPPINSNSENTTFTKDLQEDQEIRRIIKEHKEKLAAQNREHEIELGRVRERRRNMNIDAEEEIRQMSASLKRGNDGRYSLRRS